MQVKMNKMAATWPERETTSGSIPTLWYNIAKDTSNLVSQSPPSSPFPDIRVPPLVRISAH